MRHVVIFGCGAIAEAHARTLRSLGAEVSFASRDAARAEDFRRRLGGRLAFGSYDAGLQAPADAVLVATPPATHLDLVLRGLAAGRHVIVEKPAFLSVADLDAVAAAAARAGREVMVAENHVYRPLARDLRRRLADGAVGELLYVQVNALKMQRAAGWRADPALAGGGALFEGGIHWVSFLANLGPPVLSAQGYAVGATRPERSTLAVLRHEGGAVSTLAYSWEVPSPLRGLRLSRIHGREGAIVFESNGAVLVAWGRRKALRFPFLGDASGRRAMHEDFLRAIAGGGRPFMDLARARRDHELLDELHRTAGLPLAGDAERKARAS